MPLLLAGSAIRSTLLNHRRRLQRPILTLCRLRRRFADHRLALGTLDDCSAWAPRRFSAHLRWRSRCAYLTNKPPDRAPHLPRCEGLGPPLPRSAFGHDQLPRQHQFIAHHRNNISPTLHLLGPAYLWSSPQQILLVKAIAVFLPKPMRIEGRDLRQGWQPATQPPEPGLAWLALGVRCQGSRHRERLLSHIRPQRHFMALCRPTRTFTMW
jgi:hypothetical protein